MCRARSPLFWLVVTVPLLVTEMVDPGSVEVNSSPNPSTVTLLSTLPTILSLMSNSRLLSLVVVVLLMASTVTGLAPEVVIVIGACLSVVFGRALGASYICLGRNRAEEPIIRMASDELPKKKNASATNRQK